MSPFSIRDRLQSTFLQSCVLSATWPHHICQTGDSAVSIPSDTRVSDVSILSEKSVIYRIEKSQSSFIMSDTRVDSHENHSADRTQLSGHESDVDIPWLTALSICWPVSTKFTYPTTTDWLHQMCWALTVTCSENRWCWESCSGEWCCWQVPLWQRPDPLRRVIQLIYLVMMQVS